MTPLYAFFIYLLIWWVVIFAVLPIGVQRHDENGKGFDPGAPKVPDLKKKVIMTTIISAFILLLIEILVRIGVIRWMDWFEGGF